MIPRTLKAVLTLLVLVFCSGVLGAGYFYMQSQERKMHDRENEIESLKKSGTLLKEDLTKLQKREKTVVYKNRDLRDQTRQFESQKQIILNQIRTSVAGFETFRQTSTEEIAKLKSSVTSLESEKKVSQEKLETLENLSKSEKEKLTADVARLTENIERLRATATLLAKNLDSKDRVSMVRETAKLHYNLGNYYFKKGVYNAAAVEYKKAVFYEPNDADANFNLAMVSDNFLDDRKTAIFHYRRYLELRPDVYDRKKILQRILDLEIRDRIIDEPVKSQKQDIFKNIDKKNSNLGFMGDKS